jgi:predicted nuclease of predicted toxin-antitoxin system
VTPKPRKGRALRPGDAESLLLDEMFSPALAATLAGEGFDVLAVAGHPLLAALSDPHIALWAAQSDRRVVTENVRDFAPLLRQGDPPLRVLFTSSRRFTRSRRDPGPLLRALREWLTSGTTGTEEEWLR